MAQNPLLGKRISLISKKNIRYEGVLYSINEQNATVALQNVRSFGTEGRESSENGGDGSAAAFVAPTDAVHPYLLFRGQDIRDLHVHEKQPDSPAAVAAGGAADASTTNRAIEAESSNKEASTKTAAQQQDEKKAKSQDTANNISASKNKADETKPTQSHQKQQQQRSQGGHGKGSGRRERSKPSAAVGTGASLLNRRARGAVNGSEVSVTPKDDFDFQSNLDEFKKNSDDDEENEAGDDPDQSAYEKNDFFDTISCDQSDRLQGVDNRLRGANERKMNTETFGAVALNTQRRRRYYNNNSGRGGRGRGRGGSGRGSYRGRGRGRGGSGRGSYRQNNYRRENSNGGAPQRQSATAGG